MRDRKPANPGRVLITPENGVAYYATVTRADNPVQQGDALNKQNLLPDEVAEKLGLDPNDNPVPADAFDVLAGKISMELLWENASPTSGFAAQTVKLDLSRYRKIYIEFARSATTAIFASAIVRVGEYNYLTSVYIQSIGAPYIEQRQITVQEDGISFSGGRSQNVATTSGYTTVNDIVIPCYIYGIKGVS